MSEESETPSQRQARIRQQKREAKIKSQGQERLDKITALSGRAPEHMSSASPLRTPSASQDSTPARINSPTPVSPSIAGQQASSEEQMRLQQEYMRVLLGGGQPGQDSQGQNQSQQLGMPDENDPMIKMMQSMLGGLSGDPNAPDAGQLPFSADDISKMTGMPSFLTSMFLGGKPQAPPSPEQVSKERTWKVLRILLSVVIGIYTVFTVGYSVDNFGHNPPAPATIQNPFLVFVMGELLVNGARTVVAKTPANQSGFKTYIQAGRAVASDGAIVLFMLGAYSWWKGYA